MKPELVSVTNEDINKYLSKKLYLSPSAISDFRLCPARFWYTKIFPSLKIEADFFEFGTNLHKIIERYYTIVEETGKSMVPDEVFLVINQAVEDLFPQKDVALDEYKWHLKQFEKFEKQRLSWCSDPRPLVIEKKMYRSPFMGIIDAIFIKGSETVAVDWKGGRAPKSLPDYYQIQGCIYSAISEADKTIFYFLTSGKQVEIDDCKEASEIIKQCISEIKSGKVEYNPGEHCDMCPAQLVCYNDWYSIDMDEL